MEQNNKTHKTKYFLQNYNLLVGHQATHSLSIKNMPISTFKRKVTGPHLESEAFTLLHSSYVRSFLIFSYNLPQSLSSGPRLFRLPTVDWIKFHQNLSSGLRKESCGQTFRGLTYCCSKGYSPASRHKVTDSIPYHST